MPACARMGTCMVVSAFSSISIEDVVKATDGGLRWFQLYVVRDMEVNKELILRAEKAGCKAITITVDTPATGKRTRPVVRTKLPKGKLTHFPPDYFQAGAGLTQELSDQTRIQAIDKRLANVTCMEDCRLAPQYHTAADPAEGHSDSRGCFGGPET